MIKRSMNRGLAAGFALAVCLGFFSCFDSGKGGEELELTLNNIPLGADSVRVLIVDASDPDSIFETVWEDASRPPNPLRAPLGSAEGQNWQVRVEGYQNGYLVYDVLISSDVGTPPVQLEVRSGWPGIEFTRTHRDTISGGDSITFFTKRRLIPSNTHWHLIYGPNPATDYLVVTADSAKIPSSALSTGFWVRADIRLADHSTMAVQDPDTILADEALNPAGSSVQIDDAFLDTKDTVNILLSVRNFQLPLRDEPIPGRGTPMVHDKRGMRLIPEFQLVPGYLTHLVGPSWALSGIDTFVVALHYNSPLGSSATFRIRPTIADTMASVDALRLAATRPSQQILSHTYSAARDTLYLNLERLNFTGLHNHIFRNVTGDPNYQLCFTDRCAVDSSLWSGASALVVAAHNSNHALVIPVVKDSLPLP